MVKFGERIRSLASQMGKDEQDVAKDLGLTKSRLSHYISGRSKVPSELLQDIVDTYNINPLYLFNEDAPLYVAKETRASYDVNDEYTYYPTAISAGLPLTVDGITEASKISISDEVLGKYANDRDIFFVRANGESMNNLFEDGSLLAIKPVTLDNLKNGDIVVYSTNGEYSVKHYHKTATNIIFRANSRTFEYFDDIHELDAEIKIHGKVVTYIVNVD